MPETMDLKNDDLYQPFWLIELLQHEFPHLFDCHDDSVRRDWSIQDYEDYLYGSAIQDILQCRTGTEMWEAVELIRSIDLVQREENLHCGHFEFIRYLVSSSKSIFIFAVSELTKSAVISIRSFLIGRSRKKFRVGCLMTSLVLAVSRRRSYHD